MVSYFEILATILFCKRKLNQHYGLKSSQNILHMEKKVFKKWRSVVFHEGNKLWQDSANQDAHFCSFAIKMHLLSGTGNASVLCVGSITNIRQNASYFLTEPIQRSQLQIRSVRSVTSSMFLEKGNLKTALKIPNHLKGKYIVNRMSLNRRYLSQRLFWKNAKHLYGLKVVFLNAFSAHVTSASWNLTIQKQDDHQKKGRAGENLW